MSEGPGANLSADDAVRAGPDQGMLDANRPHPARIYDYWLGGKDHLAVDRLAGDRVAEVAPWVVAGARANRRFLARAVRNLAGLGVEQFLDLGSGLPATGNVHEVAQGVLPRARVVYVDNDPVVLAHARALLATDSRTVVVDGDLTDPGGVLDDPVVGAHLDLSRPVAVLLVSVLHFVVDDDRAAAITATVRDRLVPGSYLVLSHVADLTGQVTSTGSTPRAEDTRAEATRVAAARYADLAAPFTLRTPARIAALFDGFTLLPPGLVPAGHWRAAGRDHSRTAYGRLAPILAGLACLPTSTQTPGTAEAAGPATPSGGRRSAAPGRHPT